MMHRTRQLTIWIAMILMFLTLPACNEGEKSTQSNESAPLKIFKWKMATTWPPNFPIFQDGVEQFAKDIHTMSNGQLQIQVFADKELIPAMQVFDAVSQGSTIQIGHGSAYYWAGKVPAAQFMSAVPFGMTAKGVNAWFYGGGGLELWRELYKSFSIIPFPAGNSGVQMGGWFNRKIDKVEDLKGLKMRIPGLGGKVLSKAGGTPVLLAGGEVYTALERGAIDATEWVGPYHDERLGLYRAAKYYYYPGWHEPGTALELIVNAAAFAELPANLQKMIEIAAQALNQRMFSQFEALNITALHELTEKYQVQVLSFPPEVLTELKRLSEETLNEEAAKDATFKKVYEAYKAFQMEQEEWDAIADNAYSKAR